MAFLMPSSFDDPTSTRYLKRLATNAEVKGSQTTNISGEVRNSIRVTASRLDGANNEPTPLKHAIAQRDAQS
jgi:hypothetical protein